MHSDDPVLHPLLVFPAKETVRKSCEQPNSSSPRKRGPRSKRLKSLGSRFRGNDEHEGRAPDFGIGATGKRRWGSFVSFAPAASRDRGRRLLIFQPRREVLL